MQDFTTIRQINEVDAIESILRPVVPRLDDRQTSSGHAAVFLLWDQKLGQAPRVIKISAHFRGEFWSWLSTWPKYINIHENPIKFTKFKTLYYNTGLSNTKTNTGLEFSSKIRTSENHRVFLGFTPSYHPFFAAKGALAT